MFIGQVSAREAIFENFKFKDTEIRTVLQAIALQASRQDRKINIMISPEIQGLVSIDLEGVDWETALNVLLKTNNLGFSRYKNVITVAPLDKILESEKQEQLRQSSGVTTLKVFKLKYIDAYDAKKAAEPLLSKLGRASVLETTGQSGWQFGIDTSKRARSKEDKLIRTKVLVVSDVPGKIEEISSLLDEIDVMPKQILIKARIMEVNRGLLKDIGFDWGTGATGAESSTMFTTPLQKKDGRDIVDMAMHSLAPTPAAFSPTSTGLTADNSGLKFLIKKVAGTQFEVILHALEDDSRTNTLSAPVILTLNNQEATILIGTKFPIIRTEVSTQTNYVIGGSLQEYKDIGIQLNVVPQVCGENENLINMIVHPAVSSYSTTAKVVTQDKTTLVEYPIINTREAETQLVVNNGETVVMGGLLKDVKTKEDIGIPFLSKIPILGIMFKRQTDNIQKIDLLIFITAQIIKPGEAMPEGIVGANKFESEFNKEEKK
jgi:type IV pilus assembly protein PilQ